MSGIYNNSNNKYVLTNIPSPPPGFRNFSDPFEPGIYLNGHDTFNVTDFKIVSLFHRQIGVADEVLLGVISVFLMAIISELLQTILMRTGRDRRVFPKSLQCAALVDEVAHFRNIWCHIRSTHQFKRDKQNGSWNKRVNRLRAITSAVFLIVSILLLVAEVVAVLITQPLTVETSETQYNLQGVQPMGASIGVSKYVLRRVREGVCTVPVMGSSRQNRNFLIKTCFIITEEMTLQSVRDLSSTISVGSWYHSGGSDHRVMFDQVSVLNISIRSELFPKIGSTDLPRRITYKSLDNAQMDHARYIHRRFIHATAEWSCNQQYSERTCSQVVDELKESSKKQEERIYKWKGHKGDIHENVTGLVSTFETKINAPYWAIMDGVRELITSGGIHETKGPVTYHVITDDSSEDGVPGLLSEQGRVVGLLPISLILAGSFCALLILRFTLKPISLTSAAMGHVAEEWVNNEDESELAEYRWENPCRHNNMLESNNSLSGSQDSEIIEESEGKGRL